MLKQKKYLALIIFAILILLAICGVITRKSYKNDVDVDKLLKNINLNLFVSEYESDITEVFKEIDEIDDANDLIENSPIIIRAKLRENVERTKHYYTVLSQIDVLEVYKGEVDEKSISLFEPIDIVEEYEEVDSLEGYNLMQKDREYILFLRPLKDSNYTDDKFIYLPTTTVLSKYMIDSSEAIKVDNNSKYADIKHLEVFLNEENNINKFNKIKSEILKKYYEN